VDAIMNPEWIDIARNDLGSTESLGPNDSPLIRKALAKLNGLWLKGQPWCGSIMAYWMQQCALPYPKDYYRAISWAGWGTACGPVVGAVVVFRRDGGGHVGICIGRDRRGYLRVLGGNQGDAVKESLFDPKRVLAYRWPPGRAFVDAKQLPVTGEGGEVSRNEA
jgi:uncharacterized protein (TIGR02594 family)